MSERFVEQAIESATLESEFLEIHDRHVLVLREVGQGGLDDERDLRLFVDEARLLRDYLNRVIP